MRTNFRLLCLLWGLTLGGCLSRPALVRQTFAFQGPEGPTAANAQGRGTLFLHSCDVSPLFAGQSLIYRTGKETYEADPNAMFLTMPSRALVVPIRAWLRRSGLFRDVLDSDGLLKPDLRLQVYVTELYGDFRDARAPAAVLSLRALVTDGGGKKLLHKEYSRSVPLKDNTAAELVAGWNQALGEIVTEAAADLAGGKAAY